MGNAMTTHVTSVQGDNSVSSPHSAAAKKGGFDFGDIKNGPIKEEKSSSENS